MFKTFALCLAIGGLSATAVGLARLALAVGGRLAVRAGLASLAKAAGWRPLDARSLAWLTT